MFNIVRKSLKEDAVNQCIKHETYEEFSRRVKKALLNFPKDIIDNTIESLPKRMKLIFEESRLPHKILTELKYAN